jgi:hypothetical protein
MEETDVDGFNLAYVVMPETYQDIVDLLAPELQRRGVYKKEYRPGTLPEKLFGQGPYLPETHPGNSYALISSDWQPGRKSVMSESGSVRNCINAKDRFDFLFRKMAFLRWMHPHSRFMIPKRMKPSDLVSEVLL